MKKIFSIVLALVLIFALAVPSYAVTADEQSTSLKSGWGSGTTNTYPTGYNTSWFYRVLYWLSAIETSANSLVDSNGDIYGELMHIDSSVGSTLGLDVGYMQEDINVMEIDLSNMRTTLDLIYGYVKESDTELNRIFALLEDFEPYIDGVEGLITNSNNFLDSIGDDVSMLQQVLADEDDLAFKQSQKENQEAIQDTFFSADSDLSINLTDLEAFGHYIRDYKNSFNFRENVGTDSPLTVLSEGSDFMQIFTSETGLSLDPSFQGSSGGIVTPPDLPQYTAFNILPYALTSTTSETIFSGVGYRNNRKFSGLNLNTDLGSTYFLEPDEFSTEFGVTGYFYCEPGDVFYFYNIDAGDIFVPNIYFGSSDTNILSGSFWEIYKPDSFTYPSLEPDENGVYSYTIPSLPAGTNEPNDIIACRFMFSGSLNSGSFISMNEYPFENAPVPDEPEPEPIVNWLPLATTDPGGTEIYNGKGWQEGMRWSSSSNAPSAITTMFLTGWIPVEYLDTVYFYDFSFSGSNSTYFVTFSSDSSYDTVTLNSYSADENGVFSFDVTQTDAEYFRVSAYYISDDSVITINQYPIQSASVSSYSLRSSAPVDNSQVVTSYYADREAEFQSFIRGDFSG